MLTAVCRNKELGIKELNMGEDNVRCCLHLVEFSIRLIEASPLEQSERVYTRHQRRVEVFPG